MQIASPIAPAVEFDVREIVRDGRIVAVLKAIDYGDAFTVVTEVFGNGEGSLTTAQSRPYPFPDAESAEAFIAEAVTSFTYLGCEVRRQS